MPEEEESITLSDLPEEAIEVLGFLRGHLSGTIRFDGDFVPLKIVIAPDGRIIAPVMVAMLRSLDCAVFLPHEPSDEEDRALQLQVDLEQFEESGSLGALADRWRIYHGDPPDVNWAIFSIEAAKMQHLFISGEALQIPNALAEEEASICREINQTQDDRLGKLVKSVAGIELDTTRLVGVDQLGFDVRGRFDIARIPSGRILVDGNDARTCLKEFIEGQK